MYALVEYKGKQYKAEKGAILQVDKLADEKGKMIDIDSVLLVSDGDKISIGAPYVKGAKVQVVVEDSFKDNGAHGWESQTQRPGRFVTRSGHRVPPRVDRPRKHLS